MISFAYVSSLVSSIEALIKEGNWNGEVKLADVLLDAQDITLHVILVSITGEKEVVSFRVRQEQPN